MWMERSYTALSGLYTIYPATYPCISIMSRESLKEVVVSQDGICCYSRGNSRLWLNKHETIRELTALVIL